MLQRRKQTKRQRLLLQKQRKQWRQKPLLIRHWLLRRLLQKEPQQALRLSKMQKPKHKHAKMNWLLKQKPVKMPLLSAEKKPLLLRKHARMNLLLLLRHAKTLLSSVKKIPLPKRKHVKMNWLLLKQSAMQTLLLQRKSVKMMPLLLRLNAKRILLSVNKI